MKIKSIKPLSLVLAIIMLLSFASCKSDEPTRKDYDEPELPQEQETETDSENENAEEQNNTGNHDFNVLYNDQLYILRLEYNGLDDAGLVSANELYGSEGYGTAAINGACSITFAKYRNGTTGAVRGMDLQLSDYCSYELYIHPGKNVKYATWALAYTGMDEKTYKEILNSSISNESYKQIPYTATDTMSFGKNENGEDAALYCAVLMRTQQNGDNGELLWTCPGTYPGAPIRCCTQSLPTLIATQCITIDDMLKYVGAVDEDYNRIYPDVDPTLNVYSLNIEHNGLSIHWFEAIAMEDSTGRHGVLEFIDNYPIWHEGIDYSFNFFLQDDYLYNEDGTYKEKYGCGVGRYEAVVPYLDKIHTINDHLALMDGIRYSFMTYYNEEEGYVGYNWEGDPVDWRSEFSGYDIWASYHHYKHELNLDTSVADAKYKIWSYYINTNTGELELVDSYEYWLENRDHLKTAYTMNYVLADENYDEIMNLIRWSGLFYDSLTFDEVRTTGSGWETYFRVIADPMHLRVTRWFNELPTTADTLTYNMVTFEHQN